jgi:hypothetical protein
LDFGKAALELNEFMNCKTTCCIQSQPMKLAMGIDHWAHRWMEFKMGTQEARNNAIIDDLLLHQLDKYNPVQWKKNTRLFAMDCCWSRCYPFLFAVKRKTVQRRKEEIVKGEKSWEHRSKGKGTRPKIQADIVEAWLRELQTKYADSFPDTKKYELPPGTKGNYWADYALEQKVRGRNFCSRDYFVKIWKQKFPDLIAPKHGRLVPRSFIFHSPDM